MARGEETKDKTKEQALRSIKEMTSNKQLYNHQTRGLMECGKKL